MPATKINSKALKRAAAYLRVSDDDLSVDSIDKQRDLIEAYSANHGYEITEWYIDDGISAHAHRDDFERLLNDAQRERFDYALVWKQNRFSRSKPYQTIASLGQLEDAGVKLVSTEKGVIDVTELSTLNLATVESEKDHEKSLDLSKDTLGGQARKAAKGMSAGQQAPYGMDRMYVDEHGNHRLRLSRGERAPSGAGGVIFVLSEDQQKVETVRFIFRRYLEGAGYKKVARELNAKGIQPTRSTSWNDGSVRAILKNEKYCGDHVWNKRREGKFHSQTNGEATPRPKSELNKNGFRTGRRTGQTLMNDRSDWVTVEDAFEAIVSRQDW